DEEFRTLFYKHVPEVASGTVEVVSIARERGVHAMVAVRSRQKAVDPVSACVGPLRQDEFQRDLGKETVSIVLWSASLEELIRATISSGRSGRFRTPRVTIDTTTHTAQVQVESNVLQYMTSRGGLRLKLASRLVGWEILLTPFKDDQSPERGKGH